jgi:ABC-type amino acid transport substrate-binding protein/sugar lactone lactonase YvrE
LSSIAGYEILEELGRGGRGVVYRARHLALNRIVALKMVLAGAHAAPEDLGRFRAEALTIARLQHPNITQIHEIGEQEGLPFFSLEFCGGGSLQKKLAGTPLQPKEAAALVETLARATQAAHQQGIIHRDLKPANVLFAEDGTPKIADFGLAKLADADESLTRDGQVLGTLLYMAPEQAAGQSKHVGPAADVYALGAILYECLTGRPPFRAATDVMETLYQVLHDEPVPVRRLQPSVPADLETICHKCLQKESAKRYASAADLAEDLRRFQADESIRGRPVGQWERGWRWCRRHPWPVAVAAVASALLLAVAVLVLGNPPDDSLRRVQRAGELKIAVDPTYPPMEEKKGDRLVGFDIDLAHELTKGLKVKPHFVEVRWDWGQVTKDLDARKFDVVISGVTIMEDRAKEVDFVEYLPMPFVYVCKPGLTVQGDRDLKDRTVAAQWDTPGERWGEDLKAAGKIKAVRKFGTVAEVMKDISEGPADVALEHGPIARHYAEQLPGLVVQDFKSGHSMNPDKVGIALRKQDKALRDALAEQIKAMQQKRGGPFDQLLEKWFGDRRLLAFASYPEGPSYFGGKLYYTEYGANAVKVWDGSQSLPFWKPKDKSGPTAILPLETGEIETGKILVACYDANSLVYLNAKGEPVRSSIETDPGPNDLTRDAQGGVYFSTSGVFKENAPAEGKVYYLTPRGEVNPVATKIHYPNGLAIADQGESLLVAEHLEGRILKYPIVAPGTLDKKFTVWKRLSDIQLDPEDAAWYTGPDGLKVDSRGNVYICQFGASRILVTRPDGTWLRTIHIPYKYVTNVAFGPGEKVLYVTAVKNAWKAPYPGAVYEVPNR